MNSQVLEFKKKMKRKKKEIILSFNLTFCIEHHIFESENNIRRMLKSPNIAIFTNIKKYFSFSYTIYIVGSKHVKPYWVTQKLPQIYVANHATFPIRIRKITVQIFSKKMNVTRLEINHYPHTF